MAVAVSTTQATSVRRSLLLGTVAAGMLLFGYGREARAQVVPPAAPCNNVSGATVTCTGDVSDGIEIDQYGAPPDTFDTLIVNGVTKNITPATTVDGIYFGSDGNVTINSDTTDGPGGPFSIITTGDGADGIEAFSYYGTVTVTHKGSIHTDGNDASGIYADGYGKTIVRHTGTITTLGDYSYGIDANSEYGSVTVKQTGKITTGGYQAIGIAASAYGSAKVTQTGTISTQGDYAYGIAAASGYGTVTQTGTITTRGYNAYGIAARSLYGAKVTQTGNISTRGDYADGINAYTATGPLTVTQTGTISTRGYAAFGISAFSYAGNIKVNQTGNISTHGDFSYGIDATSILGSVSIRHKGNITTRGAYADGITATVYSGKIIITQSGDITVTGYGADAIDVNNCNCYGYGYSRVTIKAGSTITGGPGPGDGIDFDGYGVNRVVNFGTITTVGDNAIDGESGAEIIDNYGTITGNVDLGYGANRFNNRSGGVFNSGTNVYLGVGNTLNNAGKLSPGGSGTILTTALTGKLVQTSGGQLATDINLGAVTNDRVNITGTAKLGGKVKVAVQNPALLTHQFTILSAAGGTTNNGLGLLASPALQAQLLFPNATDVVLSVDVDFAPDGLNRNQTHIGQNLNQILGATGAGGGALGPVYAGLFNVFTLNGYRDALDQLSPEIYADTQIAALYSSFDFSDNLLSCHVNGTTTASINYEGQCLWVGAKGRFIDGADTFQDIGFDETAGEFAGGAQFALNSMWRLGFGLGYQATSLSTSSDATSDGDQVQGGVSLKYNPGALLLAGTVSGGRGWYDTKRLMDFGGFNRTAPPIRRSTFFRDVSAQATCSARLASITSRCSMRR